MNNKKEIIKRLVIFCIISFVPLIIAVSVLNGIYGEKIFASENAAAAVYCLGVFGMFAPTVGNILTRLITKEGFKDTYLGLNFKGNGKYYAASVLVKLAEIFGGMIIIYFVFLNSMSFGEVFPSDGAYTKFSLLLIQVAASIIVFFPAFGEEWGWRGYMMPKLIQLIGKPAAVIVGGIIWGLWHAPLTVSGHNFGIDYPGFPWLGIALMCVFCIAMNAFLTLLTERTKSIYPAAFCHMVNNNCGTLIMFSVFGSEAAVKKLSEVSQIKLFPAVMPLMLVTGIVSFILLIKKDCNLT